MAYAAEKFQFKIISIFEGLDKKDKALLTDASQRMEVKKGKVIYSAGQFSRGVYLIRKGKIKIFQLNKDGREQISYIYRKGEIMGYRPLISGEHHPVTAVALESAVITFIPGRVFLNVLYRSPLLMRKFMVNLAHEFTVWANMMASFTEQPAKERVALVLLILRDKYKNEERKSAVSFSLTRENLASYARTTVETLVRMLRHLKDEKIIKTKGRRIYIIKPKELEKIAAFTN